jgi:isoquinoline 1-oxidoreductase
MTAGSRTTPSTIPAVRQGCAAARELLAKVAAKKWNVEPAKVRVAGGKITADGGHEITYADLAVDEETTKAFSGMAPTDVAQTPIAEWKVLGAPLGRPNAADIVTGRHQYPSDIRRPGMLYGKILRSPTYGGKLTSVDLGPAKAMPGVIAVQDGAFAGVAAPNSAAARAAIDLLEKSAKWEPISQVTSNELFEHLGKHIRGGSPKNPFADDVAKAAKSLTKDYHVAYVQHAPMETRSAVAEWQDGKLTVWTATQNPSGVRGELARAFRQTHDNVRVIVPDFGGGFGGKHYGEFALECAKLAQAAGKPVSLQWSREEEFTWAYFRPAALIQTEASLDDKGNITSWFFVNVNSGGSAVETPYRIAKNRCTTVQSEPPLRHGSYRALASTANIFARESLMDELAKLAGKDPLTFRLNHIDNPRLRAVLEEATKQFDWSKRFGARREPGYGLGLACGTEKGSFVAACAEVLMDGDTIHVRRVCQAYECGKIMNPSGLKAQNEGAIMMGIGPALREEIRFEKGQLQTTAFSEYKVPRFADMPKIDVHLLDRPDLPSTGAGETPIVAVAPAIANAVADATGKRVRQMPIRLSAGVKA